MYFSTSATAAVLIAFTSIFSSVHAGCVERPKYTLLNKLSFGGIFRSPNWCKPGEKPDPPFDFKKWSATHTVNRPTGVFGYARPTGTGIFWHNRFGTTGTAGNGRPLPTGGIFWNKPGQTGTAGTGRLFPTGGVFWHKPGQTGTAVSRMPRPTFTFHQKPKSTSTASTTTTNRKAFQTPKPRAVEWAG